MTESRVRHWCWLITGSGAVAWLGFGLNLGYELGRLDVVAPSVLAFLLGSGLSAALLVGGWLIGRESWVDTDAAKRVVGWCFVGGGGALVTQSLTPEVAVRVETTAETVTVHVADNGPGTPHDEREELFDLELERQHRFGLYLARTLVSYYGGEITVSDNEPRGTVMSVELQRVDGPSA